MGAGARKINNQRSQQVFDASRSMLNENAPGTVGGTLTSMMQNPYSAQETQDMRTRAMRPIQAAYANDEREMDRARSLGGGYAPNYIAARSKVGRDRAQGLSDATTDVNARLAEDSANKKLQAAGALGGYRQGAISGMAGAPRHEGFNWSGLANLGMGIGSAFLMRPPGVK